MPITRQQFELGITSDIEDWMRSLADFLERHKDEAFSVEELWRESGDSTVFERFPEFQSPEMRKFAYALEKLVDHGVVLEREIAGVSYYSIGSVSITQVLES